MNKKETIRTLLRKYSDGKISESEMEILFHLIGNDEFEDAFFSEQYRQWENISDHRQSIPSSETFDGIKDNLKISEDQLQKDALVLKGLKYDNLRSTKIRLYTIGRYAAVFVLAALITGMLYFLKEVDKKAEIVHHEIMVPNGSKMKLVLADSSEVWLNSGSTLRYPDHFAEAGREVFLEGEAFFNIRKKSGQAFYVRTPEINIKVLGTSFNVKTYPDEDMVVTTLVSGSLQIEESGVSSRIAKQLTLDPNQKAYYSKKTRQLRLGKLEPLKSKAETISYNSNVVNKGKIQKLENAIVETSWKDNQLIFRNELVDNLSKKLERWYGVDIHIMDDEVRQYRFSGTIEGETVEQALNAFSIASDLDYKILQNKIEIRNRTKSNY